MTLTAELFDQISTALKADRGGNRDQRGAPRVGLRAKTRIVPMLVGDTGAAPIDVWVRDLSMAGIGLIAGHPLPQGSTFSIALPTRSGEKIKLVYKVAHCNQASATVFAIGASLESKPEPKAVPSPRIRRSA